jgi:hypothetical protein
MPPRDHFKEDVVHIASIFRETLHVSDRVAAISCAALLDDVLGAALSARFVKVGKDWQDRIFDNPTAPLGNFHSKIIIGYAIGLFGPLTRANLDIIRSIRNDFAHSVLSPTFDDSGIATKCNRLTRSEYEKNDYDGRMPEIFSAINPRNLYITTSQHVALRLSARTRRKRPISPSYLP